MPYNTEIVLLVTLYLVMAFMAIWAQALEWRIKELSGRLSEVENRLKNTGVRP